MRVGGRFRRTRIPIVWLGAYHRSLDIYRHCCHSYQFDTSQRVPLHIFLRTLRPGTPNPCHGDLFGTRQASQHSIVGDFSPAALSLLDAGPEEISNVNQFRRRPPNLTAHINLAKFSDKQTRRSRDCPLLNFATLDAEIIYLPSALPDLPPLPSVSPLIRRSLDLPCLLPPSQHGTSLFPGQSRRQRRSHKGRLYQGQVNGRLLLGRRLPSASPKSMKGMRQHVWEKLCAGRRNTMR